MRLLAPHLNDGDYVMNVAIPLANAVIEAMTRDMVLYSLYWVFWGGVQKKEVKKGKIVVTDVQVSTAACI